AEERRPFVREIAEPSIHAEERKHVEGHELDEERRGSIDPERAEHEDDWREWQRDHERAQRGASIRPMIPQRQDAVPKRGAHEHAQRIRERAVVVIDGRRFEKPRPLEEHCARRRRREEQWPPPPDACPAVTTVDGILHARARRSSVTTAAAATTAAAPPQGKRYRRPRPAGDGSGRRLHLPAAC